MALNTGSNNTNTNNTTSNASAASQDNSSVKGYRTPSFGIPNQSTSMGSGGPYFEELYKKLQVLVKLLNDEGGSTSRYGIQKLLKGQAGLRYSGIILTERSDSIASAHVLMVERTGTYPDVLFESYFNTRYEIQRTPAEALDAKYVDQVRLAVSNVLKLPVGNIVVADGTLIPNEFDIESDGLIADLFNNSTSSTSVEIETRVNNYRGQDITEIVYNKEIKLVDEMLKRPQGRFTIDLNFNNEGTIYLDQTGMPVRQDICIILSFKGNNNSNPTRSINQDEDTKEIVRTYGYIDFEYVGPRLINGVLTEQKFTPNFVITHIEAPQYAPTPDIIMMAVASVMSITEGMAWTQAFKSAIGRKNEVDYNDVGALNVDGNLEKNVSGYGKKYDHKAKTGEMELSTFIQKLVNPVMMVSIDIPKAGPETWMMSAFRAILENTNPEALKRVIDFMTFATGGAYVASSSAMFEKVNNKIHGGYYKATVDGKTVIKDIREISSYLSVANHLVATGQQPILLTQYTNTLYSNLPPVLRATSRKQYIDEISKKTCVVKQMLDRLTFDTDFIAGWVGTLKAVGFNPEFSSGSGGNDMFARRATANFRSANMQQDIRLMSQQGQMPGTWGQYGNYNRQY